MSARQRRNTFSILLPKCPNDECINPLTKGLYIIRPLDDSPSTNISIADMIKAIILSTSTPAVIFMDALNLSNPDLTVNSGLVIYVSDTMGSVMWFEAITIRIPNRGVNRKLTQNAVEYPIFLSLPILPIISDIFQLTSIKTIKTIIKISSFIVSIFSLCFCITLK